ncbi:anti-repressor SinI family protein [Bacillus massiliglaciei]|nr:anti-repressor SinI family protein [Bacillus massiliglaciei]
MEGETLDCEWVELILRAKKIGFTFEEIRKFLQGEYEDNGTKNS